MFKFLKFRFLPGWFPRFRIYKLFDEIIIEPKAITTHYWRAIAYHGAGTLISPSAMNETDALAWVATFGNIAFVDREAGFIFYRPKG
jgi:hypothetical protein